MSTVAHERCVCALGAPGLFFLSLAWDVLRSLGAGSVGARALALRVRSFSRDARLRSRVGRVGGARKDGAGVSRWWSPQLLQVVRWSTCALLSGPSWASVLVYHCTLRLDLLTATILEVKVWDCLLLVDFGSGAFILR